jgi:hypothetical protein
VCALPDEAGRGRATPLPFQFTPQLIPASSRLKRARQRHEAATASMVSFLSAFVGIEQHARRHNADGGPAAPSFAFVRDFAEGWLERKLGAGFPPGFPGNPGGLLRALRTSC